MFLSYISAVYFWICV